MDGDSDSDELFQLIQAAADEGEITLPENIAAKKNEATGCDRKMDGDSDSDELFQLIQAAADEGENIAAKTNAASGSNVVASNEAPSTQNTNAEPKAAEKVTEATFDSSDEEDLQNFFERKYNEYGRDINIMLKRNDTDRVESIVKNEVDKNLRQSSFVRTNKSLQKSAPAPKAVEKLENVFIDPIFGLKLVQPLISSTALRERMHGRQPVEIRYLQNHLQTSDLSKDWCISGAIINKGPVQTSNAGSQYMIWRLSDLKGDIKTVSLFLFKSAYKDLWKTAQGMIIAVLNPSVFSRKDNNGESSLSIDSAQKVMILGRSKDYGICKSKKKNGEPCTAVVNLSMCEFCVYHVKQEYGKMSGRSELQSATSGRGLEALRNKVLGKSEVFYGGQSFMAEKATASKKLGAKDKQRLMTLSDHFSPSNPLAGAVRGSTKPNYLANTRTSKIADSIQTSSSQRLKDMNRLSALNGSSPKMDLSQLPTIPKLTPESCKTVDLNTTPSLSRDSFSFSIGKSPGFGRSRNDLAKARAAAILQTKPIEKSNPNHIKYRGTEVGKKRALDVLESEEESAKKKQKLAEEVEKFKNERIKQLLAARSSHADLIENHEINVQNQYFNKLEKKEAMEEKMLNTTKMDCKAVICLQCKYKAFSAAERCKDEKHKLKVIDAEKRFYECEDCGNRTITLFRIPKISCSNCQGSRWKRTGMIRDKSAIKKSEPLSIRGDEETFLGSVHNNGNINLCVAMDE